MREKGKHALALDGLLQAVSQGLISSAEAVELSTVIDRLRQSFEATDIEARIAPLEAAEEERNFVVLCSGN
jgi:hypothetical protein